MIKAVGYAFTSNLNEAAKVSIYSLLKNNVDIDVVLCVTEGGFKYNHPKVRVFEYKDLPHYLKEDSPNFRGWFTYMSMARICFAKWFSGIDRVLWLDTDTLITDSITELWDIDMTDTAVLGVKDVMNPLAKEDIELYVNTGVCMFNLDYIHQHKLDDAMLEDLNTRKRLWADQDVVNVYCKDHIQEIDVTYNDFASNSRCFDAKIVHWAGVKEWWHEGIPKAGMWIRMKNMMTKAGL